ncbi:MAG: site-2 protease family protein [Clostridiales bacterium]|jgi:Zn-dependent protease|nr:site-2 protease family protein [Eubacteriales bacterium]MDH7565379.1 site-2 protease family protein [Clostridiales bacterium]
MFDLDPLRILLTTPGILIGLAMHEFAHAYAADRLGDPTPRSQGRLTLSPLPHIDILGFILIMLVGFGWAKPVQINPRNLKHPRRDDILISIAGPFTNLLLALVFALIYKFFLVYSANYTVSEKIFNNVSLLLFYTIRINVVLSIFNLLPVPPLDGFHILANVIPATSYHIIDTLERYGSIILLILIVANITSYILSPIVMLILNIIIAFLRL